MPPETAQEHYDRMWCMHGHDLNADQHSRVYSLAYEYGHSAGYDEVEQYYLEFADFARSILGVAQ